MASQSDITIKSWNSGKFAGKSVMVFNTDKAKKVYDSFGKNDTDYMIGGDTEPFMLKAEPFCQRNRLHYEIYIIN